MALNPTDNLRIVMIGPTGTGKSATGNSLIGRRVFRSAATLESVTNECSVAETERFGTKLVVVDTPGIFDNTLSDNEFKNQLIEYTQLASPGVHAFLYFMKIGDRNIANEATRAFSLIKELLGEGFISHAIFVFTGRDVLEEHGQDIEDFVFTLPEGCTRFINSCCGGVVAVSNFGNAAKEQAAEQIINRVRVLVQTNGGRSSCYRNILFDETNSEINSRMDTILETTTITRSNARLQAIRDIQKEKIKKKVKIAVGVGVTAVAATAGVAVGVAVGPSAAIAGTLTVLSKIIR